MIEAIRILKAAWSSQTTSDKLWTAFSLSAFPLVFWAVWVMMP